MGVAQEPGQIVAPQVLDHLAGEEQIDAGVGDRSEVAEVAADVLGVGGQVRGRVAEQLDREVALMLRSVTRGVFAPLQLVEPRGTRFGAHALVPTPAVSASGTPSPRAA